MAVAVCARLDLFGPSVGAVESKSYNNFTVGAFPGGLILRPHQNHGSRKGYVSLASRASSGGSRRDYEKILARQQKRRVRHMKGVTPSSPDLMKTLDSEKGDQARLDSFPDAVKEYDSKDNEGSSLLPLEEEAATVNPNIASACVGGEHVAPVHESNNGSAELTEETGDVASIPDDATAGRVQKSSK